MPTKQILCLAFSRREGGHCFAGIELVGGAWVRPVNGSNQDALHYYQCLATDADGHAREPRVLDIVEMNLLSPSPKPAQPENWLVGHEPWRLIGRAASADLLRHITDDPELFRGYDRFVPVAEIESRPPQESLRLVSPQNLNWFAELKYGKRRFRGRFSVCGSSYDLPLTDEAYEKELADIELYKGRPQNLADPVLLALSLSDVWAEQMRHYKLIAGVIAR
jgi:hypothetical protein